MLFRAHETNRQISRSRPERTDKPSSRFCQRLFSSFLVTSADGGFRVVFCGVCTCDTAKDTFSTFTNEIWYGLLSHTNTTAQRARRKTGLLGNDTNNTGVAVGSAAFLYFGSMATDMELVTIKLTEDEYEKLVGYTHSAWMCGIIRSDTVYAGCQSIVRKGLKTLEEFEEQASGNPT